MSASGQALCTRLKKCFNSDHCPISAPFCSQALEPTFATTCPGVCYSLVHGSEKAKCPCSAEGDFCKITLEPFVTGICI